jgi:signal transduction histidine kinase
MTPRLFPAWLLQRPHCLLAACLLVLHLGLVQGPGNLAGRMLLLAHFGLFLIWQPLVHGGYRFALRGLLVLLGVVLGMALEASWGMVTLWLMALASLVAGGAFLESLAVARWTYRLAVGYLILALALLVLPEVLPNASADVVSLRPLRVYGLPLLLAMLAVLPVPPSSQTRAVGAFDLLSALLVFLVLAVVVLGAMAFMWLGQQGYLAGLILAIFTMAGALLLLTWVWNPHLGGEGLGLKFSRRVLAAGVSFDDWLHDVAQLALAEQEPLAFLRRACGTLTRFPGVIGGRGEADGQALEFGEAVGADYVLEHGGVRLHLAFRQSPSGAMLWYLSLALQVLHEFYREKVLARRLQTLSYLEAVHQTGARLTHDVKNLLQSLETLCFAASRPEASPAQIQGLVQRQLPVVAQRLHQTLEKLREPGLRDAALGPLDQWWAEVQDRHRSAPVEFVAEGCDGAEQIPLAVFRSVVDNLIQNALDKQATTPALRIRVQLGCDHGVTVRVADDGAPLAADLAAALFVAPLRSENGLGMGLYQSAELARQGGYRLDLEHNQHGRVCFRLAQEPPLAANTGA